MANIQCINIIAHFSILLTYQILSGEGRQINSVNGIRINYFQSPTSRSIRKLGSLISKSDHSKTSPIKSGSSKASVQFPHSSANGNMFPYSEPALSSQDSSQTLNSFEGNKVDADLLGKCPSVKCPDDFRPTAPGHSPGAGHFYVTKIDISVNQLAKNPKIGNSPPLPDGYQGTKPGRSPGAGHALEEDKKLSNSKTAEVKNSFHSISATPSPFFSDFAEVEKNDFRPTSPGSSPGAGHLEAKENDSGTIGHCTSVKCTDGFRPTAPGDSPGAGHRSRSITPKQESNYNEAAHPHPEQTDGFRPTAPGDSPGAGHFVVSKSHSITSSQESQHIEVTHPHAAQTDDYRPTTPGHSPGAGHIASNKN